MIQKLELKNGQLKAARAKLARRAAQKEATSGALHVVDFDQLKIENQQHLERVEEKNCELLRAKANTGSSVHVSTVVYCAGLNMTAIAPESHQHRAVVLAFVTFDNRDL